LRINGRSVGEAGMNTYVAGVLGAPAVIKRVI
jgi:D-aminopeptidase